MTELLPGSLDEGAMVVIGQEEEGGAKQATTNPFAPQGMGGPRGGGGGGQRAGGAGAGRGGGR
jgi:hypothetical protein